MTTFRLFIGVLLFSLVVGGSVAHAATITVDTTTDNLTANDGDCTLREAIENANNDNDTTTGDCVAGSGVDTIDIDVTGTIDLTMFLLIIESDLIIQGPGATDLAIDGGGEFGDRVFHIDPGNTVVISGLTIQNGDSGGGGCGGLRNDGTLTLNIVTVNGNRGFGGGGICNFGTLTLNDSTVSGNNGRTSGAGGIDNNGTLTLNESIISGNTAEDNPGGGIWNFGTGTLTLNESIVSGNSSRIGGGIFNGSLAIINDSIISGNEAFINGGGGIWNANNGTLTLNNSTVSGNSATDLVNINNLAGGGIGNEGTLTINDSTVSANDSGIGPGGGIFSDSNVDLKNTIVANNLPAADCEGSGTFTSLGHNLDSDNSCNLIESTDLPNINPLLGPLQDNGGLTFTHALLLGSSAIDAGPISDCPATDQRGVTRPQGTACDIGAYEFDLLEDIDIKPGSDSNTINCKNGNQMIVVAILTNASFDAITVDHTTVTFEGASESHVDKKTGEARRHEFDVDGDGDTDLLLHFRLRDTGLDCASTDATLTGETFGGQDIEGTDAVHMIGG